MRRAAIVGVGAIGARGLGWRGLGAALRDGSIAPRPSVQLARSHPGTLAYEVPALDPAQDAGDPRARKLMSQGARLGAIALREALKDAGWAAPRTDVGCWLGVGASGGAMDQLTAMLAASIADGELSATRFGTAGLAACNPLFAFQLMNNFTLCHGSILESVGGPNGAFFSRGAGTVQALQEALWALESGDCTRALCGGADSALHPVTWARRRAAWLATEGVTPGEGAAVLALAAEAERPLAWIEDARLGATDADADIVLISPWNAERRATLRSLARGEVIDASHGFGESLAATPALAWAAAVDLVQQGARRVVVLNAGPDGQIGAVTIAAAEAE